MQNEIQANFPKHLNIVFVLTAMIDEKMEIKTFLAGKPKPKMPQDLLKIAILPGHQSTKEPWFVNLIELSASDKP